MRRGNKAITADEQSWPGKEEGQWGLGERERESAKQRRVEFIFPRCEGCGADPFLNVIHLLCIHSNMLEQHSIEQSNALLFSFIS